MSATLTVLGAGSILPRAGFGCSGYALRPEPDGAVTLLDCGPGTLRSMAEAGIGLADVRRLVISHYHPDHCLDLYALLFARRNPSAGELPTLEVVAPRGLDALLEGGRTAFGAWIEPIDVEYVVVDPDAGLREHRSDGLTFTWIATRHTVNSLAWRVTLADGSSMTYTGDTGENPDVADLARATDLFVCECSFPDGEGTPKHLTPASAGRLAARAGCERLLLTHFYPGLAPEDARRAAAEHYGGPIEIAHDRSVHEISRGPSGH